MSAAIFKNVSTMILKFPAKVPEIDILPPSACALTMGITYRIEPDISQLSQIIVKTSELN